MLREVGIVHSPFEVPYRVSLRLFPSFRGILCLWCFRGYPYPL